MCSSGTRESTLKAHHLYLKRNTIRNFGHSVIRQAIFQFRVFDLHLFAKCLGAKSVQCVKSSRNLCKSCAKPMGDFIRLSFLASPACALPCPCHVFVLERAPIVPSVAPARCRAFWRVARFLAVRVPSLFVPRSQTTSLPAIEGIFNGPEAARRDSAARPGPYSSKESQQH